jgi:penicillin-binding protein 1A
VNYSKKGILDKQQSMNSKSTKVLRMFSITFLKAIIIGLISFAVVGLCIGIGMFKGILSSTPEINISNIIPSGYSTTVYDSDGQVMTKLVAANSNRSYVKIDKIPVNLQHAFVAIEDERFYEHNGIDIIGILRVGVNAIKSKFGVMQGASTITQQLLKNNVFTDWTSESSLAEKATRKIQEQYLALEITKTISKDEVLEFYMNSINLGQNTLGVQAAANRYFNKSCSDLTLSECAVIAAITQNPSKYNPISHPENNDGRRKLVLKNMLDQGYIEEDEYEEAMADDVYSRIQTVNDVVNSASVQSYFIDA